MRNTSSKKNKNNKIGKHVKYRQAIEPHHVQREKVPRSCTHARTHTSIHKKRTKQEQKKTETEKNDATTGITTATKQCAGGGSARQPRPPPPSIPLARKQKQKRRIAPTSGGGPSVLSLFVWARQLPPLPLPLPPPPLPFSSPSLRPQQQGRPAPLCPLLPPGWRPFL